MPITVTKFSARQKSVMPSDIRHQVIHAFVIVGRKTDDPKITEIGTALVWKDIASHDARLWCRVALTSAIDGTYAAATGDCGGGSGYHKASAAMDNTLRRMGFGFEGEVTGHADMRNSLTACALYLGWTDPQTFIAY